MNLCPRCYKLSVDLKTHVCPKDEQKMVDKDLSKQIQRPESGETGIETK
jgi:hypothetical protein